MLSEERWAGQGIVLLQRQKSMVGHKFVLVLSDHQPMRLCIISLDGVLSYPTSLEAAVRPKPVNLPSLNHQNHVGLGTVGIWCV